MFRDRLLKPLFYFLDFLKMKGVELIKGKRKMPSLSSGLDQKPAVHSINAEGELLCEKIKFDNTLRRLKHQRDHFPPRDKLFLKDGENEKDFGIYKLVRWHDKDGKPTNVTILALTEEGFDLLSGKK